MPLSISHGQYLACGKFLAFFTSSLCFSLRSPGERGVKEFPQLSDDNELFVFSGVLLNNVVAVSTEEDEVFVVM